MIKPKVSRGNVKKVYKVKAPPVFVGREIKRKPKQIVASPTKADTKIDKLVDQLLEPEAEARGLTLEEYKKVRQRELKAQQKYNEEHWVSPLLDGQIFALLTLKESKPYMYMGKPVSKSNEWIIDNYKQSNKGWLEYKKKIGKNKSAWEGMHIPPSIQASQENLIKTMKQIQKSVEPLRKTVEKIKSWNNPIASHLLPFGMLSSIQKEFPEGLLSETRKIRKPDNGLNSYATRHNLQDGIELSLHYLKTHKNPAEVDYAVTSYENSGALADSVGMTPQELFKITADHIKLKKTEYKKRVFEMQTFYLVEMIVNDYLDERQKHKTKGLGAYTLTMFYKTPKVKNFLKQSGLKMDYKRFANQMSKWIRICTSKAHKKN